MTAGTPRAEGPGLQPRALERHAQEYSRRAQGVLTSGSGSTHIGLREYSRTVRYPNQPGNQGGSLSTYTSGGLRVLRLLETLAPGYSPKSHGILSAVHTGRSAHSNQVLCGPPRFGGSEYSLSRAVEGTLGPHTAYTVITRKLWVLRVLTRWGTPSTRSGYTEYPRGEAGAPTCHLGTLIAPIGVL